MDVDMSKFIKLCTLTLFKLLCVNKVRLKLIISALYIWCKLTVVSMQRRDMVFCQQIHNPQITRTVHLYRDG